jgi:hypothetical protein
MAAIFRRLFDDASMFPPASLSIGAAVAGHLRHGQAWYSDMSGPLVCADAKITSLSTALTAAGVTQLDLALVLPGGVAGLVAAADAVSGDPRLRLRAVEVPIAAGDEPVTAIRAVTAALDRTPLAGATAFVEVPARQLTAEAARAVDDHRYLVKIRTGGTTAEAFPDEKTLARCLTVLAEARLPFKCTAGLHHAVRFRDSGTGFEHHGFLNVMLGVAAAIGGADSATVAAELADTAADRVAARIGGLDAETGATVRGLFTSVGTCSTDEPVADLVSLGLVSQN